MTAWHIAVTLPRHEEHVVKELRELGFDAVCPSYRKRETIGGTRRQWRGRARTALITVPAFPNYVMLSGAPWQRAQEADGLTAVIRTAGDRDRAAALPQAVAQRLLGPNNDGIIEDLCETIEAMQRYLKGQHVTVIAGAVAGRAGTVISSSFARVRLMLEGIEVDMPANDIRAMG